MSRPVRVDLMANALVPRAVVQETHEYKAHALEVRCYG